MKILQLILICILLAACSGCSAIFSVKWDGKNWSLGVSGEAPEVPFIDYEVDIIE
jgi:hypothetical protein